MTLILAKPSGGGAGGSGLQNVVEDTTPQAGGNFDLQTNKLVGEGGTDGVYVDSGGNVGIGTTSPSSELHVVGKNWPLTVQTNTNSGQASITYSDETGTARWGAGYQDATGDFKFAESNNVTTNTRLTIQSGGNVGIGTTSPGAKLEVSGSNASNPLFEINKTNIQGGEVFKVTDSNDPNSFWAIEDGTGASGFLPLFRAKTTQSSNPSLFLLGDATAGQDTGSKPLVRVSGRINNGTVSTRSLFSVANVNTDLFIVDADGNVGIGTTAPDTKLHVAGAITQEALSADPADPDAGNSVQWVSDGTGSGDAGDVMMKINVAGTVKTITLADFSTI